MTRTPHSGSERRRRMLASSFVFAGMPGELLDEVAAACRTRSVEAGAFVFHLGDPGDALFGVISGSVRIWIPGTRGRELTVTHMEEGDIFGEIALLDGLDRTANANALTATQLLVLERPLFLEIMRREPDLSLHVIELLCEKLRGEIIRSTEDIFLELKVRLAKRLLALMMGYGKPEAGSGDLVLRISQEELGNMLGVSREAVNKQLNLWARQDILSIRHGKITLHDQAALESAASPEGDD
ncbi:MAG: Crp/Fnr family transcriptional regulator [Limibacillus sp.]|jgi:CRP/FNR family transcriptional regulator, cyclic AMP receptor protein